MDNFHFRWLQQQFQKQGRRKILKQIVQNHSPGDPGVKKLLSNVGNMGSIPCQGTEILQNCVAWPKREKKKVTCKDYLFN